MKTNLDTAIDEKVKPLVQSAMQKYLGVKVADIETDISDQLKRSTLLDIPISTKLQFKKAKKAFKRAYLMRLLQQHLGNISTAASIAGLDRRSIHRLVLSLRIPMTNFREDARPEYARQAAVQNIVENVLEQYKPSLNHIKYKAFSAHTEALSEDIAKNLPESNLNLKEAERAFEQAYLGLLLKECSTITEAAKRSGLRYEVLHRKLKNLNIRPQNR